MNPIHRREMLRRSGLALTAPLFLGGAEAAGKSDSDWIRTCRGLICEAYNPPFYPSFDFEPKKAIEVATALNADSLRYPAASYFAYFPTKSGYPVHPELKGDPMRETLERCRTGGLKTIAYVPLNHPFMDATSKDPRYEGWRKHTADGAPMITEHYGFARYFEGCLNSPVREVIWALVKEVLAYDFDVMYFDGPYQGMQNAHEYCHCQYCEAAYRKRFGKPVPSQAGKLSRADEVEYQNWMANEVVIAFLRDIKQYIRKTRDVPVLFNDTSLLSRREWRDRAIPMVDGFMFEAAETPEEKLFNLQLGHSTGKTIWTYVGSHTEYNREHMKSDRVRGWFSYPLESQELEMDGATAIAGGAGIVYWGLSRFFYQPKGPLDYESGRYVKETFDFSKAHRELLASVEPRPVAGIVVGDQTIDWFTGKHHVGKGYENYYRGAWQVLKDLSYDAEPFLDWMMTPELLAKYKLVWVANAACLSDAQCGMLRDYAAKGGALVVTHLSGVADEYGKMRNGSGLEDVTGAVLSDVDPVEIPDLYLKAATEEVIPQDPQVVRFRARGGVEVLAETIDRGHRANLGPAIVRKGRVIYIGSGLEAIYNEARLADVRDLLGALVEPFLAQHRTYQLGRVAGLMAQFTSSPDTIVLHLLADTGNKTKKLRIREQFSELQDIAVSIRIPHGRKARSFTLLRQGGKMDVKAHGDWLDVYLRLRVHEAIRVDLA